MTTKRKPGKSLTYAERKAAGRPIVSMALPSDVVEDIAWIAERLGASKADVMTRAIRELRKSLE